MSTVEPPGVLSIGDLSSRFTNASRHYRSKERTELTGCSETQLAAKEGRCTHGVVRPSDANPNPAPKSGSEST